MTAGESGGGEALGSNPGPVFHGAMPDAPTNSQVPLLVQSPSAAAANAAVLALGWRRLVAEGTLVAEAGGRVVGFLFVHRAPGRSYFGPAVAHDLADLGALMHAAAAAGGAIAMRVPTGATELLNGLLEAGFLVEQLGNVMVRGGEPPPAIPRLLAVFPEGL